MENHLAYQVQQLLVHNDIPFDKEELTFQIKSHPSFPSLHAVTGVLDHFNIENLALDVPVDRETLDQLPPCFLVQLNMDESKEFAVINKRGEHVDVIFSPKWKAKFSITEFLEKFTGIMVAVEKDESDEEPRTDNTIAKKALIALTAMTCIALIIISEPKVISLVYTLFSLVGIYISFAIVRQDFGLQSVLGNAFCSQSDDNNSCDVVLSSEGAKLFGIFKLSDLSLTYFAAQAFTSLLLLFQQSAFSTLFLLSILAVPVTLYSIYYQYAVVKRWCALCMGIAAILWVQAGLAFIGTDNWKAIPITTDGILVTALAFLAMSTIWSFLSPNIRKFQDLKLTKIGFYKFKKNYSIFSALLRKSTTIDTSIPTGQEIVFGNTESPLSIVIITNPFCRHCKDVHTLVENIYKSYADDLRINIRFNIDLSAPESELVRISSRLLEIFNTQGTSTCLEAMHDIYNRQNPSEWLNKWDDCEMPEHYYDLLKMENEWCVNSNINFTPEILINGKSFPVEYDRSDLIYFIEDLSENAMNNINNSTPNLE